MSIGGEAPRRSRCQQQQQVGGALSHLRHRCGRQFPKFKFVFPVELTSSSSVWESPPASVCVCDIRLAHSVKRKRHAQRLLVRGESAGNPSRSTGVSSRERRFHLHYTFLCHYKVGAAASAFSQALCFSHPSARQPHSSLNDIVNLSQRAPQELVRTSDSFANLVHRFDARLSSSANVFGPSNPTPTTNNTMVTISDDSPTTVFTNDSNAPTTNDQSACCSLVAPTWTSMRSSMELAMEANAGDDGNSNSSSASDQDKFVQSLPYVKCRMGTGSLSLSADKRSFSARRISTASSATTSGSYFSPEAEDAHVRMLPSSLSYSVPSLSAKTNTPRGRPAVDVIATYMNTSDARSVKADLLRSHAHFSSPRNGSQSRLRSSSMLSKESSADWGWFADIDSSSESWAGGDNSLGGHLRRRMSADLVGLLDTGSSVHVLGDEQANTRISAAHKAFTITADGDGGTSKVVSATIQIPKFRIVQSRAGADRHAQYLITLKLGKELYADWRRYSEFGELIKTLDVERFPRTHLAWRNIDTRWFNRLEPSYLHQKCITLENFMRELMYESSEPSLLIEFLGGYMGKVNSRPADPTAHRPSAQLPKELRPPQPQHERELFEKMWAENFKRSRVDYSNLPIRQTV